MALALALGGLSLPARAQESHFVRHYLRSSSLDTVFLIRPYLEPTTHGRKLPFAQVLRAELSQLVPNYDVYSKYRSVLAHELGHHFTTIGNTLPCMMYSYSSCLNSGRAEYRANKWAADHLIPSDKLATALKSNKIGRAHV